MLAAEWKHFTEFPLWIRPSGTESPNYLTAQSNCGEKKEKKIQGLVLNEELERSPQIGLQMINNEWDWL